MYQEHKTMPKNVGKGEGFYYDLELIKILNIGLIFISTEKIGNS